jgi:hypothetical protein
VKAITRRRALVGLALCALTGCSTDNPTSLSRDFRNLNNEAIDALMMVTNESRAKFVNDKIIGTYQDRYGKIEKRMQTYVQNTENETIILDTLRSESVAILLAESQFNIPRLNHEQQRLKKLLEATVQREKDRRKEAGDPDPVNVDKFCPSLNALATSDHAPLHDSLKKGTPMAALVADFGKDKFKAARKPGFEDLFKDFQDKVKNLQPLR